MSRALRRAQMARDRAAVTDDWDGTPVDAAARAAEARAFPGLLLATFDAAGEEPPGFVAVDRATQTADALMAVFGLVRESTPGGTS